MQMRAYRDGKWYHVMLDEEAWDAIAKVVAEPFIDQFVKSVLEKNKRTPSFFWRGASGTEDDFQE